MSSFLTFRRVVFPVAIRRRYCLRKRNHIVVKATSLASTITILEVTAVAKNHCGDLPAYQVFLIAGAIYLTINFVITRGVMLAEHCKSTLRNAQATNNSAAIIR